MSSDFLGLDKNMQIHQCIPLHIPAYLSISYNNKTTDR